ncbi:TPA: arsenate reductase (glutaredoxin) [Streptococcus suis]|uniref:arsenate reductase (glutathione/glutaredoxin) n=1 Tax=Streptococcus suis TaxID=1307 RepID=A0AB33U0K7_STRSU|nr:arsenate reductase (glutaredoxin) [Streptococcus suis]MBL6515077.1 arsenate reductase (glutaredoxin) [Streptococcus suis]MDW8766937.1 arsenate reductase (glutaredoxin) [Streptococcus suis]NQH86085.1 arsenate reductase (glutaredoxin) [Streptococcus suis]NQN16404.1 arsenate reductase (glutaredoxin) [Streptococcus suis]NQR70573.1 arsenate reductase (glutaredoxin) [Streptococcus suis]
MDKVIIYHNPECGTSRNALALIRHLGIEPEIIHYLETPPSKEKLVELLADMDLTAKELLRTNVPTYQEMGIDWDKADEEDILSAMVTEPILISRPIVVSTKGVKLCRPSEVVLELLPPMTEVFIKEDGEIVSPL